MPSRTHATVRACVPPPHVALHVLHGPGTTAKRGQVYRLHCCVRCDARVPDSGAVVLQRSLPARRLQRVGEVSQGMDEHMTGLQERLEREASVRARRQRDSTTEQLAIHEAH